MGHFRRKLTDGYEYFRHRHCHPYNRKKVDYEEYPKSSWPICFLNKIRNYWRIAVKFGIFIYQNYRTYKLFNFSLKIWRISWSPQTFKGMWNRGNFATNTTAFYTYSLRELLPRILNFISAEGSDKKIPNSFQDSVIWPI